MALYQPPRVVTTLFRSSNILLRHQQRQRRVHIQATPSTSSVDGIVDLSDQTQNIPKLSGAGPFPADVQFEVLGAPYSMLSVALPASSTLYTRRGTLAGINGDVEHATSTLSVLNPTRAAFGIPFLYQKLTSPKPLTCLISTNTPHSTFGILQLDGKADWTITQRDALLAWSGHTIAVRPSFSPKMNAVNWGTSYLTGRGLVALVGRGQIYQATLQRGESFIVHPSTLLAYTSSSTTPKPPKPFRLPTSAFRLQVPRIAMGYIASMEWTQKLRSTQAWGMVREAVWKVKNWLQRTIWGERMFLKFEGPAVVLLQSRTGRLRDLVSVDEAGEWASAKGGSVRMAVEPTAAVEKARKAVEEAKAGTEKLSEEVLKAKAEAGALSSEAIGGEVRASVPPSSTSMRKVIVENGKARFEDSDFKEFR